MNDSMRVISVTRCAWELQSMDNLLDCSGCDKTVALGTQGHLQLRLKVGISPSSNGREQMDVPGTVQLVTLQLKVGISPSSNGRERMDVI